MTRAQTAILECVPAAGEHPEIQQGLQILATAMDWDILTLQMDLRCSGHVEELGGGHFFIRSHGMCTACIHGLPQMSTM